MFKKVIKEHIKFVTAVVVTTILLIIGMIFFLDDSKVAENQILDAEKKSIETHFNYVLESYFSKLEIIETFYKDHENSLDETAFDSFSSNFDVADIGFISFSIAPDGIMSYYYSEEYGDAILGHDLINDERESVRDAVAYSIDNNVVVINGPIDLIQGGYGIVFRKAVFDNDDNFLGIIGLVVQFDVINTMLLSQASDDVNVGIYDENNQLIFGDLTYRLDIDYLNVIHSNYSHWTIGIETSQAHQSIVFRNNFILLSIATIVYCFGLFLATTLYLKTKRLIGEKDKIIYYDSLTQLPNRMKLIEDLSFAIENEEVFYLGFGDLNNFKNLNDILGHSIGDKYLSKISDRFQMIVTDKLKVYRWGGDEFIFYLKEIDEDKVINIFNEMYQKFLEPVSLNGFEYTLSMSIGIVKFPDNGKTIDELIRRADIVMYDVKSKMRSTFGFFKDEYMIELKSKIAFENLVKQVKIDDFEIYFQPVLETKTNQIFGFESLTRLFDKHNQVINTEKIIKYYERNGEISLLDFKAFEAACKAHLALKEKYGISYRFSFNISPLSLTSNFVDKIYKYAQETNIDTSYFVIEIIETIGFKNLNESLELLNQLRAYGFNIAMDDFGIGYSSLSYITKLPINYIKIDRLFISNYRKNEFDRLLILTIKEISELLDLDIIVEGIEEQDQLDFIKSIHASYYQGYLHSRPMNFDKLVEFLNEK